MTSRKWLAKAVVDAPPDRLFDNLVVDYEDEVRKLSSLGSLSYDNALKVDRQRSTVTLRGHWWYQGATSVQAHPRGSEVTYRVQNVAPRGTRWLASLHNLRYQTKMRKELAARLRRVSDNARFVVERCVK